MDTDTRHALIENATRLVRQRGYSAFSYADLAEVVGIRKPSIHHHFPNKEGLGVVIVAAYTDRFAELLDRIDRSSVDAIGRIVAYAAPYRAGIDSGQGCLCGVLAAEMNVLPERVQDEVRQFFTCNLRWLEKVLIQGLAGGEFRRDVQPQREARTILATLQGAMSLALSLQDARVFEDALEGMIAGLRATVN